MAKSSFLVEVTFKLLVSATAAAAAAAGFCNWFQVEDDTYIPQCKYYLIYLHGFQHHQLLPLLTEITSFMCTNSLSVLHLNLSSVGLVIIVKVLLKLPNLF